MLGDLARSWCHRGCRSFDEVWLVSCAAYFSLEIRTLDHFVWDWLVSAMVTARILQCNVTCCV